MTAQLLTSLTLLMMAAPATSLPSSDRPSPVVDAFLNLCIKDDPRSELQRAVERGDAQTSGTEMYVSHIGSLIDLTWKGALIHLVIHDAPMPPVDRPLDICSTETLTGSATAVESELSHRLGAGGSAVASTEEWRGPNGEVIEVRELPAGRVRITLAQP